MNIVETKKTCEVANIASQSLGSILGTENWMHLCWLNFTHTKENSDIWKVKSFFREIVWDAYIIVITRKTALLTQFSLFYNHFLSITTTLLKLPKMHGFFYCFHWHQSKYLWYILTSNLLIFFKDTFTAYCICHDPPVRKGKS